MPGQFSLVFISGVSRAGAPSTKSRADEVGLIRYRARFYFSLTQEGEIVDAMLFNAIMFQLHYDSER